MAIGTFESNQPRGLGNVFLENALSGLGQQAGRGAGYLAGAGLSKLGRLAGIGGPSEELVQLLVSQGMNEKEARAFSDLDPRAQQQLLQNLTSTKLQQQKQQSFSALPTSLQQQELTEEGVEAQPSIADQLVKEETQKEEPVLLPSYAELYSDLLRKGVDEKTVKGVLKDYDKEQKVLLEEVKSFSKDIDDKAKAAKESSPRLMKMYKLVQNGNLNPSQLASAIKTIEHGIFGFGIDLHSLLNGDSQEFAKLSSDFSKLISNYFPGGRITNVMIDQFMKTIPNLIQSDEGKLRVISNLVNLNEAAKLYSDSKKDILKQTKGKIPLNLKELIQEKIGPELTQLEENYLNGEVRSLPGLKETEKKAQRKSRFETTGAITGGILGALSGRGLGSVGARIGGTLGSALGPAGSVLGALGGYGAGALGGSLLSQLSGGELSPDIEQKLNALTAFRRR